MGTFNLDVKCWSKKQRRWILVETRIWCCLTHRPPRVLSPWQQSCVQQQMTSEEWGPDLGGTGGGSYPAPPPLASHSGPQLQLQAWGLTPWGKTQFYITVLHHSSTPQFYITVLHHTALCSHLLTSSNPGSLGCDLEGTLLILDNSLDRTCCVASSFQVRPWDREAENHQNHSRAYTGSMFPKKEEVRRPKEEILGCLQFLPSYATYSTTLLWS